MKPPWDPYTLMNPPDANIRGQDAIDAVIAVANIDGLLPDDTEQYGVLITRQSRAIVFLPYTWHRHDQGCYRG